MIVAIDCNILVMCLTSRSPYHPIYKALVSGKYQLCVTADILLEYEEVIQLKYGVNTATSFLALLKELRNVKYISASYKWQLMHNDPDDNKYVDCAIAGKADAIVTEDSHFAILKEIGFPKVATLSITEITDYISKQ